MSSRWALFAARWIRPALLVGGLLLVGYFVLVTGPRTVLGALAQAGRFFPLFAGLEVLMVWSDVRALTTLLGRDARSISWRGWVRSSAASYACLVLLPAGRAASEIARATLVARYVGPVRAATAGAQLQAAALVGDGVGSLACCFLVARGLGNVHQLPVLLASNALLTVGGGTVLLALIKNRRVARALMLRFPAFFRSLAAEMAEPLTSGAGACLWSVLGRVIQILQYGLAVSAVGGLFSLQKAAVAHGVHAVGATLGVAVPNQVGVVDGAYLLFADTLGFAANPARALALILSLRVTQLALALGCLLVPVLVPAHETESSASPS